MCSEDLWGDLPETDDTTDPVTLLRQQASLLGSKTKNVLTGVVSRPRKKASLYDVLRAEPAKSAPAKERASTPEQQMEVYFSIRCSALDNYTFHVLTLIYPLLTIFPLSVRDEAVGKVHTCMSEDELRDALQRILGSQHLRRVISALLREARASAL